MLVKGALLTRGNALFELHRDGRVTAPRPGGPPAVFPTLGAFLASMPHARRPS